MKPIILLLLLLTLAASHGRAAVAAQSFRDRPPEDDILYFLLPDRFENGDAANDTGGIAGGRLDHGFDPTAKGFFLGGDLKGIIQRLDYIQGLGANAIWVGPIYRNKPVQGGKGEESAGYHGYWITDFLSVDPHFGSNADFKALVDQAHARGIKVYLDIITNHTADVIGFAECQQQACLYRSLADYPYSRRGGLDGAAINPGFLGERVQTPQNFARLTRPDYAYTPLVPKAEARIKNPAWLNEPIHYHNRGNSTFRGESSTLGDFVGLDDLMTESPAVVAGMIDIYSWWIDTFGIDGFRVDTARHVNPEFWQAFVPAMQARARAKGIPNFHIFGEVSEDSADPIIPARATRVDGFPAVLDFSFQAAVKAAVAQGGATSGLTRFYAADALYAGGEPMALRLPTFIGNHDMGRFATFVRKANPQASDAEVLQRVVLGHAMMMFGRGIPTVYSGDEQGFVGDGNDQDAREPLFASKVAVYNDNRLLGSASTTAVANFDTAHPLYRRIAAFAAIRAAIPALRHGATIVRADGDTPGLFAYSRRLTGDSAETLVVFNTSTEPVEAQVAVDPRSLSWRSAYGDCAPGASAPGSYRVRLAPLAVLVCQSGEAR